MAACLAAVAVGCGNETARAPVPTAYEWPDAFTYRVDEVAQTEGDSLPVVRHEQSRQLRLVVGYDGAYSIWQDSVRLTDSSRGEAPAARPPLPEDTLRYFVRLSRWGEFLSEEPGCDPAVSECQDARPSSLLMRLRRIIPKLPVWWPPRGHPWEDTLVIDDAPRPRGRRGTLVTAYRAVRDTIVAGRAFWIVTSHSVWRSAIPESVAGGANGVAEESAVVYVDKQRLVPVLAVWRGTRAEPLESPARGVARARIGGRAVLVGSVLDSPPFTQEAR